MEIKLPQDRYLKIKVIPYSPRNEIVEVMIGNENEKIYKIKIKAIPEKGKANNELIKFLSKHFDIPRDQVTIIAGKSETTKLIKLNHGTL